MMNQILIRALGYIYTFVALPALAIVGIAYYRKYKSKGGVLFAIGSLATAIGSMFNKVIPFKFFIDESTHGFTQLGSLLTSSALIVHIVGFMILVLGLGMITFQNKK
ncbi:MAG: hypothetical protein WC855_00015 [Thermodesulfovibrionales bacterium]